MERSAAGIPSDNVGLLRLEWVEQAAARSHRSEEENS